MSKAARVWYRRTGNVARGASPPVEPFRPIAPPSTSLDALKEDGDVFTLNSFTTDDAWALGNLLRERLAPLAVEGRPALISISLANSGQVLFQCVTGSGITPDHETWVQRKRNAVLRWTHSTWYLNCQFKGDESEFKRVFQLSEDQANSYAIHGGAVPIRVMGVEGIVAIVIVSGLTQQEDHGVISDVIKQHWEEGSVLF